MQNSHCYANQLLADAVHCAATAEDWITKLQIELADGGSELKNKAGASVQLATLEHSDRA
jgi:hypothetical protein